MDDLTIRPYADADAALLTDLMNVLEVAGDAGHEFTEQEIRDLISTDVTDAARDTSMVLGADGTLAAAGLVSAPSPRGSRARTVGGVHPDWRGRGIGQALLRWQFERIAEIRAERGAADQWTVTAGAGIVDESAAGLFRRAGLQPVRYFLEMRAATAGLAPAAQPAGVRIAAYTTDLQASVYAAHTEAFADHWGFEDRAIGEWAARAFASDLFRGDLSRIALADSRVVAYLLAYDGVADDLHIGLVGTRSPWRKRGLATALLTGSLAAGAAAGKTTASLGVDADSPTGAVAVYERLGFTAPHAPFAVYEKPLDA